MGETALDPRLVGAVGALAVDHQVALAPLLHEGRDHLGRVLEIRIHDDDRVAPHMVEAGRDGDLLAEIAAERHRADPRVREALLANERQGIVAAPVVDENDLPDRGDAVEHRHEPLAERLDVAALVMDRNDDAEFGGRQAIVLCGVGALRAEFPFRLKRLRAIFGSCG